MLNSKRLISINWILQKLGKPNLISKTTDHCFSDYLYLFSKNSINFHFLEKEQVLLSLTITKVNGPGSFVLVTSKEQVYNALKEVLEQKGVKNDN